MIERKLEQIMLNAYGDYNKAVDKAEDTGLISAIVAMFCYFAIMAVLGAKHVLPIADSVIVKAVMFYCIMLGAVAIACVVGLFIRWFTAKYVYDVKYYFDTYLLSRRVLRHRQRKEDEEP